MNLRRSRLGIAAAIAVLAATPLLAGVVIEFEQKSGEKVSTGRVLLEKDRVRTEAGDDSVSIYRADKDVLWVVRPKQKSYMEVTKEQAAQIGERMAEARTELERSLDEMPPEARKAMRQALDKMGAGEKDSRSVTYVAAGKRETIHGYPCAAYTMKKGEESRGTVWVTEWSRVSLGPQDMKVLASFAEFLKVMMGPLAGKMTPLAQKYSDASSPDAVPGFPIRIVSRTDDSEVVHDVKKIAREDAAASVFELPPGLKKESMPDVSKPIFGDR